MPITRNTFRVGTERLTRRVKEVTGDVLNEVLIAGLSNAAAITPRDTSNMVNSQHKAIEERSDGATGRAGYRANYALHVHEATEEKLRGQRRSSGSGNYWDPDAESEFLRKGFERDGAEEIRDIIREAYKVKNVNR